MLYECHQHINHNIEEKLVDMWEDKTVDEFGCVSIMQNIANHLSNQRRELPWLLEEASRMFDSVIYQCKRTKIDLSFHKFSTQISNIFTLIFFIDDEHIRPSLKRFGDQFKHKRCTEHNFKKLERRHARHMVEKLGFTLEDRKMLNEKNTIKLLVFCIAINKHYDSNEGLALSTEVCRSVINKCRVPSINRKCFKNLCEMFLLCYNDT